MPLDSYISRFEGHGAPMASPQFDAVDSGRELNSSDWRANPANASAKIPMMRATIVMRMNGKRTFLSARPPPPVKICLA